MAQSKLAVKLYKFREFYQVRGDEELDEYGRQSRTLAPGWLYLPQTPSVFRFTPKPEEPTLYRSDISPLREEIFRVNGWTLASNKSAYLFSGGTALFNGNSYPRQSCLTMSFNVLEPLGIFGDYLKFKTVRPTQNVSHMTRLTHPQFVHKWDIVTYEKRDGRYFTKHIPTPHGELYYFLCSDEGFGYIKLDWVRRV